MKIAKMDRGVAVRALIAWIFLACELQCTDSTTTTTEYLVEHSNRSSSANARRIMPAPCARALAAFAANASQFTLCSVLNSHPISACVRCVGPYVRVVEAHRAMLAEPVDANSTAACGDRLVNLDRLQIVESTYAAVADIWDRGHCSECFDWVEGAPRPSNKTRRFIDLHDATARCIESHADDLNANRTDVVCEACMADYLELNSFYESLKGKSEICMDIVDLMNATRSIWSVELDCCKLRRTPEFVFLCLTAVVTALPALFYLFARFYCDNAVVSTPADQRRMAEGLLNKPGTSSSTLLLQPGASTFAEPGGSSSQS